MILKNIVWFLFSFKGRLPPTLYFCFAVPLGIALFVMERYIEAGAGDADNLPPVAILVPLCVCYWVYGCILCKRLHDFGCPGAIAPALAVLLMYRAVAVYFPELMLGETDEAQAGSMQLLHGLFFGVKWLIRLTGGASFVKPGDAMENAYGHPFGTQSAEDRQRRNARRFAQLKDEVNIDTARDAINGQALAREVRASQGGGAAGSRTIARQPTQSEAAEIYAAPIRRRRPGEFGSRSA